MKNLIFVLFLAIFSQKIMAQDVVAEQPKPKVQIELGLNTTLLVKQLLDFGSTGKIPVSPYIFTAKRIKNKQAIRFGAGFSLLKDKETFGTFADSKTAKNNSANLRLGYEWRHELNSKWIAWTGMDATWSYKYNANAVDSGFDNVTIGNTTNGVGLSLVLGVEYSFLKNISVGCEGAINGIYNLKSSSTIFDGGTQEDIKNNTTGTEFSTLMPTSLFILIKF